MFLLIHIQTYIYVYIQKSPKRPDAIMNLAVKKRYIVFFFSPLQQFGNKI